MANNSASMGTANKERLRSLRRQLGLLGVRYAVFAAGVACMLVLAASLVSDRLTLAVGDWFCETSASCSQPLIGRSPPDTQRPLAVPVSAPGNPGRVPMKSEEAP